MYSKFLLQMSFISLISEALFSPHAYFASIVSVHRVVMSTRSKSHELRNASDVIRESLLIIFSLIMISQVSFMLCRLSLKWFHSGFCSQRSRVQLTTKVCCEGRGGYSSSTIKMAAVKPS